MSYYLQKLITQDSDVSSAILHFIFAFTPDGSGILFWAANPKAHLKPFLLSHVSD